MGRLHRLATCLAPLARPSERSVLRLARFERVLGPFACGLLALGLAACTEEEVPPADAGADAQVPSEPVPQPVKQLALGRAHGCSLDPAISGLVCWGDDRHGQASPPKWLVAEGIAAGGDTSCAIAKGGVTCWGDGARGQLEVPVRLGEPVQLAVGEGHACVLNAAGGVRCWGDNRYGQCDAPVLRGVRAIAAGARHSCALAADGVRCWGDDSQGQLAVPPLSRPSVLALGDFHGCAIDAGRVVCWGGARALRDQVPRVDGPRALAAGGAHSCVLDAAGVQCWGDPAATRLTPRELTRVQQLAVGGGGGLAHACARHQQGVACWGDDSLGQTDYDGFPLHVLYRAEAEIEAPPELVWDVLMDLDSYPIWNPYTIAMESTLRIGDPMVMQVKMNELLTIEQIEHIRVLEPGHKICWGIETTTPELNTGERCQWLEALPGGGTRYITEDLIEGLLNPVVLGLFDTDLQRGFDGVALGLKGRAERLRSP